MKHNILKFVAPLIIMVLLFFSFRIFTKEALEHKIKIGVPDDISGVLLNYMIEVKGLDDAIIQQSFEAYSIKDCCTNTSQWALSSGALDIAILCPNAAQVFLEKENSFDIIGSVIINSDIFVIKEGVIPKKIGVTQNRFYQETLAREKFGEDIEIVPMITNALPYTYEKGLVDGIVIDIIRGGTLEGHKKTTAFNQDNTSYVLVVRSLFTQDPRYMYFMEILKETVDELNNWEILSEELNRQKNIVYEQKEAKMWQLMETKFIFPVKTSGKD